MALYAAGVCKLLTCSTYTGGLHKFYDLYTIDEDVKAKQVNRKESGSYRAIGGRYLWGNLLDVVCAKYGWTLHYVLWEISYMNLTMMLVDAITTVDMGNAEKKGSSNTKGSSGGFLGLIETMKGLKN